jgi:hypothetical protein
MANSLGLLRMPQIRELWGRKDLNAFQPRMDIKTFDIAFKSEKLEEKRQQKLAAKWNTNNAPGNPIKKEDKNEAGEHFEKRKPLQFKRKRTKTEWEKLQREDHLLKKFKKGRMSKEELEEEMDEV